MRDLIVKILVQVGWYKSVVDVINRFKSNLQARRMRQNGLKMLQVADQTLSSIGIRAFLTYGALLGAYRDHGFISYDPDIDLGVLDTEITVDMHEAMEKAGFHLIRQNYIGSTGKVVEETYEYCKLHLDIFIYLREGEDLYSVIQRKHETKDWKEANSSDGFPCDRSYVPYCEFERRDFLGLKIYMPVDTDGWLRAIYSDSYMTPIKNWTAKDYKTRIIHSTERTYRRLFPC